MAINGTKAVGDDRDWKSAAEKAISDMQSIIEVMQKQIFELQQRAS